MTQNLELGTPVSEGWPGNSQWRRSAAEEPMVCGLVLGFSCQGAVAGGWAVDPLVVVCGLVPVLRSEVCPGKASMFSRRQSCRGKSQSPVVRIAEAAFTPKFISLKEVVTRIPGEIGRHLFGVPAFVSAIRRSFGQPEDRQDA